jgi:transposase
MKIKPSIALGIDIAKSKFDVCLLRSDGTAQTQSFTNNQTGFTRLAAWLGQLGVGSMHAGLEATGPYSLPLAMFLHEQGHTVSLLNPARPKSFAQARGCRSKTDGIDARTLAEFVLAQAPEAWRPAPVGLQRLQALVRRREDLLVLLGGETLRLEGVSAKVVCDSIQRIRRTLSEELKRIEGALEEHFESDPELKRQRRLLCTIKGVREITAAKILAELGDPQRFARPRQAGAFAGLTPRLHQSGKNQGRAGRLCKVGSPLLRKALYMPALTAMNHNPCFKDFAQRLRAAGKPPKLIAAAVMRKLLVTATAMLRSSQAFDSDRSRT